MSTIMLDIIHHKYLQWSVAGRRPTILPNVLENLVLAETSSLFLLGISPLGAEILLVQHQAPWCGIVHHFPAGPSRKCGLRGLWD